VRSTGAFKGRQVLEYWASTLLSPVMGVTMAAGILMRWRQCKMNFDQQTLTTNSMKTAIYFKLMRIVVTMSVVTAVEVFLLITMLVILEKTILLEAIQLWQLMSTRRG
jgi:hypothetical protein